MRGFSVVCGVCVILFASCQKKDKAQYSTWMVSNDKFSTNHVNVESGKAIAFMRSYDADYSFGMMFRFGGLPQANDYGLNCDTLNPAFVCISFLYKGHGYIPSPFTLERLYASLVNNKSRLTLPPAWFVNGYDPADSVLIQGEFNQP
jgi:hypothetical protein